MDESNTDKSDGDVLALLAESEALFEFLCELSRSLASIPLLDGAVPRGALDSHTTETICDEVLRELAAKRRQVAHLKGLLQDNRWKLVAKAKSDLPPGAVPCKFRGTQ